MGWPTKVLALALGSIPLLLAGCSNRGGQTAVNPEGVAGCYELTLWPMESDAEASAKRSAWRIPSVVRLESAPMTAWPSLTERYGDDVYQAQSWLAERWRDHPFAYWRPAGADSIYVGHPGALAGVSLYLAAAGERFVGKITAHTDVRRMEDTATAKTEAPVEARPIECPGDGG